MTAYFHKRVLLTVDLILTDINAQLICNADHFPHGLVAEEIGVIVLLECSEGNAEHGACHILGNVAHELEPDSF